MLRDITTLSILALLQLAGCHEAQTQSEGPKLDAAEATRYAGSLPYPMLEPLSQEGCERKVSLPSPSPQGQTAFDRALRSSARRADQVDLTAVYDAYRCGRMNQRDAAAYENGVRTGVILLGRGQRLKPTLSAPVLPRDLVAAYNSGSLSDADRAKVRHALETGRNSLPTDMVLTQ